ncbi:MAG: ABC transporter substrate-binding protein [Bacillota bacterium]
MTIRRYMVSLILLAVVVAGVGGCHQAAPEPGGVLRLAYPAPLGGFDPASDAGVEVWAPLIYDTLLRQTPDGEYAPGLAERWRWDEASLSLVLYLRRRVFFHDGYPLDAATVVHSLHRLITVANSDPGADPVLAEAGAAIDALEAIDQRTLAIRLTRATPAIWHLLSAPRGAIVHPRYDWERFPDQLPPGTGPFRPIEVGEGGVRLKRYAEYGWGPAFTGNSGPAHLTEVCLLSVPPAPENPVAVGDEFDLVRLGGGQSDEQRARGSGAIVWRGPGQELWYLGFRLNGGSLTGLEVRSAVDLGIDRARLAVAAQLPPPSAWTGHLPPGAWGARDREVSHDPVRARQLLEGVRGELEVLAYSSSVGSRLAEALASSLGELGLALRITILRPYDFFRRLEQGDFQAFVLSFRWPEPDILYYLLHSRQSGKTNRFGFADPQVDLILEVAAGTQELAARRALYDELQKILGARLPYVPLVALNPAWAMTRKYDGLIIGPGGVLYLHGVHQIPGK